MAIDYLKRSIHKFRISDFEELAPMYFNVTHSYILIQLFKLKLSPTVVGLSKFLIELIQEADWTQTKMITVAAALELENMSRQNQRTKWQAQRLHRAKLDHKQSLNNTDPFPEILCKTIVTMKEDAKILMKQSHGLMWLAVLYKSLRDVEVLRPPIHLVISEDLNYLFSKKNLPARLLEAVQIATECSKIRPLRLEGRDVRSLLKLLRGREDIDPTMRPVFAPNLPVENEAGIDYTHKSEVDRYTKECLGDSIHLQQYVVESSTRRWLGDDTPELRFLEVTSGITFSGDVAGLFKALPAAGICFPPFPEYIRDFAVLGRSRVAITSNLAN